MATQTAAGGSALKKAGPPGIGAPKPHLHVLGAMAPILLLLLLTLPPTASAGRASSGQLLFYPCTRCHPLSAHPEATRPNRFKKHSIKLEAHDALGKGAAACLVCHDSPERNPGKLKLIDGTLVDIKRNTSLVCFRCHEDKYSEWKAGYHGKKPDCTTAGCHNPHSPGWIGIQPLLPYVGTTIEIKAVGEREPFTALPGPPPIPEPPTFPSMDIVALLGMLAIAGVWAIPIRNRRRRMHGKL